MPKGGNKNCYNHLAHILVYSYNSDYRKFVTVEGIEERIAEFPYML
ncbi:MAG: hypothetical protein MR355_09490 [Lachnospiraceae bacterium]|nr:hypothetical protein [Lachnospiraceae bacterium]